MTQTTPKRRPSVSAGRGGYVGPFLINAAIYYLANNRPGWQALPFLTADTVQVLALFNASLIAGMVVNLVFVLHDAPWLKALGNLVTTSISLAVSIRMWQVFPFAFGNSAFDWALLARAVLVLAIVGSAIGIVAALVSFVRRAARGASTGQ